MNWLRDNGFGPRPIVVVEDHVSHITTLLRALRDAVPDLLENITVVCLDRSGLDTDEAVADWLELHAGPQVVARLHDGTRFPQLRVKELLPDALRDQNQYCRLIATLVRKRGLLLQDIELEPLEFVPRDRWWETTMLATTVRGIVGERTPKCAFISNKRGYEATFGAELLAAGHDPRDVLNKYEMERVVVPFLSRHMREAFPLELRTNSDRYLRLADDSAERREVEASLDIVIWPEQDDSMQIGGRALASSKGPIQLSGSGNEATTWLQLARAFLARSDGVDVQELGTRVASEGALRAEATNAAARHIHTLRKRLTNSKNIVTVQGHYRFASGLSVGVASRRVSGQ